MDINLLKSWQRTEGYLRDARSHLSQIAEADFADGIREAEQYLEHNELGLAFDALESIAMESQWEGLRFFELLALAAASMSLVDRQKAIDGLISRLRGWTYETNLPT
ncbi:hypothetical protein D0B54_04455 [Solimonas sp. K1W22B-7]|uniref:hypothetical protein n=1 Tax=Solimonas sp. K1W22B-7 TaxID=2303331 RepID=UPI000E336555|nr:hypothetical protein [Solimonas sp. K1W22B-7]AXQ27971.1 hypothetical protein D0B54_04455 [Solimonas sp. K1W22B-7]